MPATGCSTHVLHWYSMLSITVTPSLLLVQSYIHGVTRNQFQFINSLNVSLALPASAVFWWDLVFCLSQVGHKPRAFHILLNVWMCVCVILLLKTCKKNHTLKLTRPKVYTSQWIANRVAILKLWDFTVDFTLSLSDTFLCTCPPPKMKNPQQSQN